MLGSTRTEEEDTIYGVEIMTNSGKNELFWHPDEQFVGRVAERIFAALEGEEAGVTINLDNRTIENKTTVHNYFDYGIHITQYDGVPPEQMAFFQNQLAGALADLGEKFEKAAQAQSGQNDEALDAIRKIAGELNTPRPDPSRLRSLWEKVKASGEVGGFAADLVAFGRLLSDGISILG